jgi:putative transposase
MHRPIQGKIKNVTVSCVAREWFASVQMEQEATIPVSRGPAVGLDFGSARAIAFSDGTVIDLPRTTSADRKRLATAQRAVARGQKGSRNREKTKRRMARLHARRSRLTPSGVVRGLRWTNTRVSRRYSV